MTEIEVVFFDIGDTLATASNDATGQLVLNVLPGVPEILDQLQQAGLRLGLISNTGSETTETMRRALADANLYPYFAAEPQLLIYSSVVHMKKDSPEIFRLACEQAGLADTPERCVFVGESATERTFAFQAGLRVAATPAEV
jgi:FMN phosphatase YigB (HAD superfamily)